MRRAVLLLLIVAALVALGGCGGGGGNEERSAAPADGVVDLQNVLDLRAAFEADRGKQRLLVLLSPT